MKPNLTIYKGAITVAQLRADRSLRPDIIGELHPDLWGEIHPDLRGDLSGLRGVLHPDLQGELHPDLRGDLSGLRGELPAGARGNLDACELTDDDRAAGINVADLIASN